MRSQLPHQLTTYDPAEDLDSKEAVAAFIAEALQTRDAAYASHALEVVARARATKQVEEKGQD
jgi:probable addiction module antidote protein